MASRRSSSGNRQSALAHGNPIAVIDDSLIPLLQCPWSRRSLVLDDDAEEIRRLNDDLAHGRLVLSSGERLAGSVEAVLRTADAEFRYPVIEGIPFLLKESVLRKSEAGEKPKEKTLALTDSQRQLMEKFSRLYHRWYGEVTASLQQVLQERYYPRFEGGVVLDVGNGGTAPDVQLGAETARKVDRFIALDNSSAMLTRSGIFGNQILGDCMEIPLASDSVDYVLANNTLHHFGLGKGQDPMEKIGAFFREALRVSRKGLIINELVIPKVAELVERVILQAVGFMPVFVFSESFYRQTFQRLELNVAEYETKSLMDLISPFTVIPPILEYHWLRVPALVIPYSFAFFVIEKKATKDTHSS